MSPSKKIVEIVIEGITRNLNEAGVPSIVVATTDQVVLASQRFLAETGMLLGLDEIMAVGVEVDKIQHPVIK